MISLREGPGKRYFRTQSSSFDDFSTYRKSTLDEVEQYWNEVCDFVRKKFPADSLRLRTRIAVVVERLSAGRRVVKDVKDALRVTIWGRPSGHRDRRRKWPFDLRFSSAPLEGIGPPTPGLGKRSDQSSDQGESPETWLEQALSSVSCLVAVQHFPSCHGHDTDMCQGCLQNTQSRK